MHIMNTGYKAIIISNKAIEIACKAKKDIEDFIAEDIRIKSNPVFSVFSSPSTKYVNLLLTK